MTTETIDTEIVEGLRELADFIEGAEPTVSTSTSISYESEQEYNLGDAGYATLPVYVDLDDYDVSVEVDLANVFRDDAPSRFDRPEDFRDLADYLEGLTVATGEAFTPGIGLPEVASLTETAVARQVLALVPPLADTAGADLEGAVYRILAEAFRMASKTAATTAAGPVMLTLRAEDLRIGDVLMFPEVPGVVTSLYDGERFEFRRDDNGTIDAYAYFREGRTFTVRRGSAPVVALAINYDPRTVPVGALFRQGTTSPAPAVAYDPRTVPVDMDDYLRSCRVDDLRIGDDIPSIGRVLSAFRDGAGDVVYRLIRRNGEEYDRTDTPDQTWAVYPVIPPTGTRDDLPRAIDIPAA